MATPTGSAQEIGRLFVFATGSIAKPVPGKIQILPLQVRISQS